MVLHDAEARRLTIARQRCHQRFKFVLGPIAKPSNLARKVLWTFKKVTVLRAIKPQGAELLHHGSAAQLILDDRAKARARIPPSWDDVMDEVVEGYFPEALGLDRIWP
jgi:hypothetical protein